MSPKFSIIIPVYNVAPYLRECLDSVLAAARTLSEKCEARSEKWDGGVEVICVDDGSTDGSGAILDEYAEKFERRRRDLLIASDEESFPSSNNAIEGSRRQAAERKISEWTNGVDEMTFGVALGRFVGEAVLDGTIRLREDLERRLIVEGATLFYKEFSRFVVSLSDSRCVYFVPDQRSRERGVSNARAWAEYAVHAVTNGGALIPGKDYHTRWYNHRKVENFDLISKTLLAERCVPVLRNNPIADSIKFFGETHDGGDFDVVVRLDEYGNAEANMTEVTFEASKTKKRTPRLKPLSEAIEAVVCHQAAGTNPSTLVSSIAHRLMARKGGENALGSSCRHRLDFRVIHQKNAGVGAARNAALAEATALLHRTRIPLT